MTKRGAGDSSISRGADGRWHGYVSMGLKENGQRDRRHVAAPKRADVLAQVKVLEEQRDAGIVLASGKVLTVEQWMTLWLDTIAARRIRPSTATGYRSCLTRINRDLGHHRLDRLQPEHLEAFYTKISNGGLSPATVLLHHRVLSRALKVAMQRGRIARNVATLVDAPTVVRDEVKPLSAVEARQILEACRGQRNAARWSVALALGLRQGEALGARWPDVDLEAGTWTVRQGLQRRPYAHGCPEGAKCPTDVRAMRCPKRTGGLVSVDPKSAKGKRTISLPAQLLDALRAHRAQQAQERLAAGSSWQAEDLVFAQVNGRPIDPRRDWQAWKDLLSTADVRDARLHDARHTAATMLLQQGVPARVAMQILGHSQISLTLGTYSHVVPELAQDAADRMGNALWG